MIWCCKQYSLHTCPPVLVTMNIWCVVIIPDQTYQIPLHQYLGRVINNVPLENSLRMLGTVISNLSERKHCIWYFFSSENAPPLYPVKIIAPYIILSFCHQIETCTRGPIKRWKYHLDILYYLNLSSIVSSKYYIIHCIREISKYEPAFI